MKRRICYLSGRYVDTDKAVISALDRGFLFGEGLFETWRTYCGHPFALREHLARMAKSARILKIPFDPRADWEGRTLELARRNRMLGGGGAIRLTITAGAGEVNLVPTDVRRPTQLMLFRPLEPGLAQAREHGVGVHLMDFGSGVNANFRRLKTLNYLPAVVGKLEARKRGCFESLYRLADTTVLEGTTSNFFIVKNGKLLTTPVADGILPGVTRALVAKVATPVAPLVERRLCENDLFEADEMFLTSSTIEVVPILRVGRRRIADGRPGELTRELQVRYRRNVARRLGVNVDELGE
jgi:branched-subunit amino acid aminotransferase/4-amino-4-deoxychorismate lyase